LLLVDFKKYFLGGGRVFLFYAAWVQASGTKAVVAYYHAASSPKYR
jgi:hypothetical protein